MTITFKSIASVARNMSLFEKKEIEHFAVGEMFAVRHGHRSEEEALHFLNNLVNEC